MLLMMLAMISHALCEKPKPEAAKESPKMEIFCVRVPPGFVSAADPSQPDGKRKPWKGFKSKSSLYYSEGVQYDATDFLKSQGIDFPPGSDAVYDEGAGILIVRNTREALDLVDTLLTSCGFPPVGNVVVEIAAYECGKEISADGWPTYAKFKSLPPEQVKLLDSISGLTRGGHRTVIRHLTRQKPKAGTATPAPAKSSDGESDAFSDNEAGIIYEIEPTVGPDNMTIDASYRFLMRLPGGSWSDFEAVGDFTCWEDYPTVLQVYSAPGDTNKVLIVIGTVKFVNPGGWKFEALKPPASPVTE